MTEDIFTLSKKHGVMIEINYLGFVDAYRISVKKLGYKNEKTIIDIDIFDLADLDMCEYIEVMIKELELFIAKQNEEKENDDRASN